MQPEAVVWRGNPELPESKQGLRVLGVPVGHPSCILAQLEQQADEHKEFLRRVPVIQDVQSVLVAVAVLRCSESQLLVEDGPTRIYRFFCKTPRRGPLDMSL